MIRKLSFAFSLCLFANVYAGAQSCDPWITQAYKQLYGRGPTTTECAIKNYNNGSWSSYDELVGHIKSYNKNRSTATAVPVKGDPWIFQIYKELYGREPNAFEVNIQNYNSGSWSSYDQLKGFVREYQASMNNNGLSVKTADLGNGNTAVGFFTKDGKQVAVDIVANNGGKVLAAGGQAVASGGSSLIGQAAGNLIGQAGGNIIGSAAGNVIAPGGANIALNVAAGVVHGSRTVQSTGAKVIKTSGSGGIIIR